jgi:hypothetical protein
MKKIPMQQPVRLNIALNAVLVSTTSIIIAPSYSADEHISLIGGFFFGLFISVVLRAPGAYFELYLARRNRYRRIYITHVATGLFVALVVLSNHYPNGADTAGSAVGIYLLSSSVFLGVIALITFIISHSRRRDRGAKLARSEYSYTRPSGSVGAPTEGQPSQNGKQVATSIPAASASSTSDAPPINESEDAAQNESEDAAQTEAKSAIAQANRAGLVLGIVTGIASLVQGYDAHNAYRTLVALAAGGIGVAIIYLPALKRRRLS